MIITGNIINKIFPKSFKENKPAVENVRVVTYDDSHRNIAKSGAENIKKVLFGNDKNETESLLFCLDYYLDPYYGYTLPYEKEIFDMLQELAVSTEYDDIADDALMLISEYSSYPVTILENNFDSLSGDRKETAKDIIDDFKEWNSLKK